MFEKRQMNGAMILSYCDQLTVALFRFITDMPSERATVLSNYLKISRKRNRLNLILELKVIQRLLHNSYILSVSCIVYTVRIPFFFQASMEVSCLVLGLSAAWRFMTGRTQN